MERQQFAVADAMITNALTMQRTAAGTSREVLKLLRTMQRDLVRALQSESLTDLTRARKQSLLRLTTELIETAYGSISTVADEHLNVVIEVEASATSQALGAALGPEAVMPTAAQLRTLTTDLLIHGAPSAAWWQRHAGDTAFRFANEVRQGIAQGEANGDIVKRVTRALDLSKTMARKLVHSSVQTAMNASRMAVFDANADMVNGVQQVSTLDGRTSPICAAYSGGQWNREREPINGTTLPFQNTGGSVFGVPRHWNCRSVLIPILIPPKGVPEFTMTTRASVDGQVSADLTFAEWLDTKSVAFQDDMLGKGRAQLWRDGVITLSQLLDQSGNPLTLAQLRARYKK